MRILLRRDATAHVHPYQSERFEVLEGLVGLRIRETEHLAGPGDVATVAPGTPHRTAKGCRIRFAWP